MHPLAGYGLVGLVVITVLMACGKALPDPVAQAYDELPERIDYNFHVQPILSDRCYQCHGPDAASRKADLRLDIEKEAFGKLSNGHKALVRGRPSSSHAIKRCVSDDPDYVMPPPESKLELSPREIAILYKWLEQGGEWKPHWSFIPPERPVVPEISDDEYASNPIDNFIAAKHTELGLTPNARASKERLIRRVTMDLTGLPPTLDEIDAFVSDESTDAYEKLVDRLLASEACAERLALEWMDVARYSDSHGVSFDGARNSWPYRDWVIDAFKQGMTYDSFLIRQIAGDMLEGGTDKDKMATAFYRMGQLEVSQGSIPEEFRMEYVSERTGMTGTALLGLTLECARCHDHKFDPISQREYYQVAAFFNNTCEQGLSPTDVDRAPTMYVYQAGQHEALDSIDGVLSSQRTLLAEEEIRKIEEFVMGETAPIQECKPDHHVKFDQIAEAKRARPKRKKKAKTTYYDIIAIDGDTSIAGMVGVDTTQGKFGQAIEFDDEYDYVRIFDCGLYEMTDPFSVSVWINTYREGKGPTQTIAGNSAAYISDYRGWDLYLDSLNYLRARLIHRLPDDYIEVKSVEPVSYGEWTHVGMTYDGLGIAEGITLFTGDSEVETETLHDALTRSILPRGDYTYKLDTVPLRVGKSRRLWTFDVGMFDGAVDELAVFNKQLSPAEMALTANTAPDMELMQDKEHMLVYDSSLDSMREAIRSTLSARHQLLDTTPQIMILEDMEEPRTTYVLEMGVYDQPMEKVEAGGIERVLPFEGYSKDRLGLAGWLTDPGNPLTSRVAINRYWQMIFGKGIVKTAEDFGIQGDRPTHPELLDWLSVEFVESGWDLRHMLKLMVTSSTYCQSSEITSESYALDPTNDYYSRGSSYRLQAEMLRDNALAASGLLVNKVGGPPVKPYQPDSLWRELGETSFKLASYKQDTLDDLYRRSIYTFSRRFVPPPFMSTFDASSREICQVRRDMTNSPLQALVLLNDPQIVEASRVLAERVMLEEEGIDERIELGYRLATGVTPSNDKLVLLRELFDTSYLKFNNNQMAADSLLAVGDMGVNEGLNKSEIAAMTIVASTIFNSDEAYMKR